MNTNKYYNINGKERYIFTEDNHLVYKDYNSKLFNKDYLNKKIFNILFECMPFQNPGTMMSTMFKELYSDSIDSMIPAGSSLIDMFKKDKP